MAVQYTFNPYYGQGQSLAPAVASAAVVIGAGAKTLCLTNTGAAICYVRAGAAGVVATAADYLVPPGVQVTITKDQGETHLATISAAGTTLHVIPGEGF